PLLSETWEGGIYVVCRQNEPSLTEKEMELLAIIGTTGNGALRGLETHQARETKNIVLDEFYGMVGASKAIREGKIGEDVAALLGAMLVSRMGLAALSRTDTPEANRRDFYVYLDEFQSFTTLSVANMLSELRKYRVGLILAHQYLSQLDLQVRDAILGNVGTMIAFRLGLADAEILENEFRP